jgi:hypothetical protein
MSDDLRYSIDLSVAQTGAERIIECIRRLREWHDTRPFEFTKHVRVAPTELPHSHPILTFNTQLYDPEEILCEYLHGQMHWYTERLNCASADSPLIAELKQRYPHAPTGFPEGANDEYATYLHLLVNWLEIEAASRFLKRERAEEIARRKRHYRWIYHTVLADWLALEELFRTHNIAPIASSDQLGS